MNVGQRIKELREQRQMTQEALGALCGTTKQTIFKYETGIVTNIPMDRVCKIAEALHVSPAYLMGWEESGSDLSSIPGARPIRSIRLPILGHVSCGEPKFASEEFEGYVDAEADITADFCLIAKGDSMINIGIEEGTVVFIRRQDSVENGQIAVVIYDDDATLKRVYYYPDQALLILRAENPRYKDITFVGPQLNAVRILGRAVMFQREIV